MKMSAPNPYRCAGRFTTCCAARACARAAASPRKWCPLNLALMSAYWEIQNAANIFLHVKWRDRVEANGFASEMRSYQNGMKDGGRHSALSRDWSFGDADCIVVRIDSAETLRRLLDVVLNADNALALNPAAITRWIER